MRNDDSARKVRRVYGARKAVVFCHCCLFQGRGVVTDFHKSPFASGRQRGSVEAGESAGVV